MCIYDATHYACTAEDITLVQQCPCLPHCLPHIRQTLFRTAVCRLCAIAGLEDGARIVTAGAMRRSGGECYSAAGIGGLGGLGGAPGHGFVGPGRGRSVTGMHGGHAVDLGSCAGEYLGNSMGGGFGTSVEQPEGRNAGFLEPLMHRGAAGMTETSANALNGGEEEDEEFFDAV
ncbi:hypothetical protein B0A55_03391 [Friedmanniomyces simplex]|uniref:Uncharacterized protein n=1 Tax=Friedmanniomyces simplex TaxID=329884 RepID=A0A4U0XRY3_9PEZI|nr:hypothetical protein B0A55_03391 [Friedmanniomyces simplex]